MQIREQKNQAAVNSVNADSVYADNEIETKGFALADLQPVPFQRMRACANVDRKPTVNTHPIEQKEPSYHNPYQLHQINWLLLLSNIPHFNSQFPRERDEKNERYDL